MARARNIYITKYWDTIVAVHTIKHERASWIASAVEKGVYLNSTLTLETYRASGTDGDPIQVVESESTPTDNRKQL